MSNDLVVLDMRHRVPSGISEYALSLAPRVAQELLAMNISPVLLAARHQIRRLPANYGDRLLPALRDEHYVHFDDDIAAPILSLKPRHVHSFGPLIDPRWCESFSVTWHDVMRLRISSLVYTNEEVTLRSTARELHNLKAFDEWCQDRFGWVPESSTLHGRSVLWCSWLARERASFVATVSETSKHDVQSTLGLAEPPVVFPPLLKHLVPSANCPDYISAVKPFFLFVGTPEEHKRLDLVCDVLFSRVELKEVKLVVVGDMGHESLGFRLRRYATATLLEDPRVVRLGYVTDSLLARLYADAIATVIPSSHEGYCLPAAECMRLGGMLVVNQIPTLRETIGSYGGAEWFDLDQPSSIAQALIRVRQGSRYSVTSPRSTDPVPENDSASRLAHLLRLAVIAANRCD